MKRLLSGVLSVVFLLMLLPLSVWAAETDFSVELEADRKAAAVGGTATVSLFVSGEGSYNSYYFTFSYDKSALQFESAAFSSGSSGELKAVSLPETAEVAVYGYGAARSGGALQLRFKVLTAGASEVRVTSAYVDDAAHAGYRDAPGAVIKGTGSATVYGGGYPVTKPDDVTGEFTVTDGSYDYTFRGEAGLRYNFKATVNGVVQTVINNNDGSYTVKGVTGPLTIEIVGKPAPMGFDVTVTGSGAGDVTYAPTATYGQDYAFTVSKDSKYNYTVTAAVNGKTVDCTYDETKNVYIIAGSDITGPVTISVEKTMPTNTTLILFTGNSAGDMWNGISSMLRENGKNATFAFYKKDGYDYAVTAQQSDGSDITLSRDDTTYQDSIACTIPGGYIQGGIITVTITRTEHLDVKAVASEYVDLKNGSTVFLINATVPSLPAAKSLYYNGTPMFRSEAYEGEYIWLVTSNGTLSAVQAAAQKAITARSSAGGAVVYSGDVNVSGKVDINDAQYIYNVYNAEQSPLDVERFLRCDMNKDGKVTVEDARAVADLLVKSKA